VTGTIALSMVHFAPLTSHQQLFSPVRKLPDTPRTKLAINKA